MSLPAILLTSKKAKDIVGGGNLQGGLDVTKIESPKLSATLQKVEKDERELCSS